MSNKLIVKTKGKDSRPKSGSGVNTERFKKGNRKDGTPEISTTPSHEPEDRLGTTKLWNDEIAKLQIKQDDLVKIQPPHPPSEEKKMVMKRVTVKKVKKITEPEKIASPPKPEHSREPISVKDYAGYAGPRYDEKGDVIPYSILGKYEDFHREAVQRGDLLEDLPVPKDEDRADTPSVKYEKKRQPDIRLSQDESNALRNWNIKMMERKRQQGYISNLLQKPLDQLAMNQADNFRAIQEQRYLIDRNIPKVDYGKGYRVGSEFWNQQRQLGDDLLGMHMSLTQTQKGYPPSVEHVGVPKVTKEEKGCEWIGQGNPHINYPWHKSDFLNQRLKQLQPYIDEMDPWKPDFDNLQVIGKNKINEKSDEENRKKEEEEFDAYLDGFGVNNSDNEMGLEDFGTIEESSGSPITHEQINEPIFGPAMLFGGQQARWTGDGCSNKNQVAMESRVTFEAFTGDRITSHLQFVNNGTTAVYYDWKRVGKENPFEVVKNDVQRFYFNSAPGVVLPGETVKFPYVFKSPTPGVYTEQWKMETRPILCGGAALVVTLRGVAVQEDKFKQQREKLEKDLAERQAKQIVSELLLDLVKGIRTPERSRSPIDAYITEEEIFSRNNPQFQYAHELVSQLKDLHSQLFVENERVENVWSLSVEDLHESIMELEDDDLRDNLLQQMNTIVAKLTYIPPKLLPQQMYCKGYQLFLEAIDRIVGESLLIRHAMGLPVRDQDNIDKDAIIGKQGENNTDQIHEDIVVPPVDDSRRGNKSKGDAGKGGQGKASAKSDGKLSKTPTGKPDPKGKTPASPAPPPPKKTTPVKTTPPPPQPPPPGGQAEVIADQVLDQASTDNTVDVIIEDPEIAAAEQLYKDTFAIQVYNIVGELADSMDLIFTALRNE